MEFKVDSLNFTKILKTVIKGYDSKDSSSFVELDLTDEKMTITARSIASFFQGKVEVKDLVIKENEQLKYYVNGAVLKQLASILPETNLNILFSVNDKTKTFNIKYPGNNFRLPIEVGMKTVVKPHITNLGEIKEIDFIASMNNLSKVVDNNPLLQDSSTSCLDISLCKDVVKMMATDRYVIAEIINNWESDAKIQSHHVLIRHTQLTLLNKSINPTGVLTLIESAGMFGYIDESGIICLVGIIALVAHDITPFKTKAGGGSNVTINAQSLKYAIDTVSKLSFIDTAVDLIFDSEQKRMTVKSADENQIEIAVQDMKLEQNIELKFARNTLLKALAPTTSSDIRVEWGEPLNNGNLFIIKIVSIDDNGDDVENEFIAAVSYESASGND